MQCPYCNDKESKVIDSRHLDSKTIKRRRECENCKKRFTTYEKIELVPLMVIKKDKSRQVFDASKIRVGIIKSCEKRPVSIEKIDNIVKKVEIELNRNFVTEVESNEIGKLVMDELKDLDEVAYVRFASVYRQFKDLNSFVNALETILTEKGDEIE